MYLAKTGHGPHSSYPALFLFRELYCSTYCCDFNVLFYVLFDCVVLYIVMYVNVYHCHRVSTQLRLNILSLSLWNPNFLYRIHTNPPFVSILSQISLVHALPTVIPKIYLILYSHLRLFFRMVPVPQVSPQNPCTHLSTTLCMPHASHSASFDYVLSDSLCSRN